MNFDEAVANCQTNNALLVTESLEGYLIVVKATCAFGIGSTIEDALYILDAVQHLELFHSSEEVAQYTEFFRRMAADQSAQVIVPQGNLYRSMRRGTASYSLEATREDAWRALRLTGV